MPNQGDIQTNYNIYNRITYEQIGFLEPTIGSITTRYKPRKPDHSPPHNIEYVIYTDKGWMPCNGQVIEESEYPLLYKVLQKNSYPNLDDIAINDRLGITEFCVICNFPVVDDYICPSCAKEEKSANNNLIQLPNLSGPFNV